jgi:ZIP family zinc transporter
VLLATIAFEMIPRALELGSLPIIIPGFIMDLATVYALNLFMHRGQMAVNTPKNGRKAECFYMRQRPREG